MFRMIPAIVAAVFVSTGVQAAPVSLVQGATEGATPIIVTEQQNLAVKGGQLDVDYLVGTNLSVGDTVGGVNNYSGAIGLEGGVYDSFLIHFDPVGRPSSAVAGSATFDFVGKVVALVVSNGSGSNATAAKLLNESDMVFGLPSYTYETNLARRSEANDLMTLVDATTLSVNFLTRNQYIDNIRVITEASAIPLPATLPLLLAGFGGLAAMRRKRRAA